MSVTNLRCRADQRFFLLAIIALSCAPLSAQHREESQLAPHTVGDVPLATLPAASEPAEWPETPTVRELLRIDAARAALAARQSWSGSLGQRQGGFVSSQPAFAAKAIDKIHVKGIYGMGSRLHAEVIINGRVLYYSHGQPWPDGGRYAASDAYALLAVYAYAKALRCARFA